MTLAELFVITPAVFGKPLPRPLSCEERGVSHRTPPSFVGKGVGGIGFPPRRA